MNSYVRVYRATYGSVGYAALCTAMRSYARFCLAM